MPCTASCMRAKGRLLTKAKASEARRASHHGEWLATQRSAEVAIAEATRRSQLRRSGGEELRIPNCELRMQNWFRALILNSQFSIRYSQFFVTPNAHAAPSIRARTRQPATR